MLHLAAISSVAVLAGIAIQDIRHRAFVWWLLPILLAGLLLMSLRMNSFEVVGMNFLFNLGFVVLQLCLLWIWFSLRERRWIKLIDTHIGLGDVLLLVCLGVAFSPVNFILFVVGGLLFSLLVVMIYRVLRREAFALIPLAALLALPMTLCCAASVCFGINLHSDGWLLPVYEIYSP
ncbi:MAG: hypothetical protein MUC87_22225 [Bacteroidia bacterium]|jgi:hypothetical protein|nr:hypothetical protein [Bacteroidia bacterium]